MIDADNIRIVRFVGGFLFFFAFTFLSRFSDIPLFPLTEIS